MYFISEDVAISVVSVESVIPMMEEAFRQLDQGMVELLPVVIGNGFDAGTSFGAKGGLLRGMGVFGFKFGSYWPENAKRGLKTHGSTTLLLDPATGFPMALIGAKALSSLRAAALDAIAIRELSRADSTTLAILGSGQQAWWEFVATMAVRPISRVLIWSRTVPHAQRLADRITTEYGIAADSVERQTAVSEADIVITATAATSPLIERTWVRPGTHISAMGADIIGKQELPTDLVANASLFTDIVQQSTTIGEFKTAFARGEITAEQITPIAALLAGRARGRVGDEVTIFDSSGTALQDLVIAKTVLEAAILQNRAIIINEDL